MNNYTPIVLFCFNRFLHTKKTLDALAQNELASESVLYIYVDGPKKDASEEDLDSMKKTREVIRSKQWCKEVHIIERDKNIGLADSIITGVTEIVNKYGKVIVLEDDIVTSPGFLTFMNRALDKYESNKKVWHIAGWNYPAPSFLKSNTVEVYGSRFMNCWGWATWSDRWVFFEKNPLVLKSEMSAKDIYNFNLDGGCDYWSQVEANISGSIDTWAIFWYASIFKHGALCITPFKSFVNNIGHDGTGVHCSETDKYSSKILNNSTEFKFPDEIFEDLRSLEIVNVFMNGKFWRQKKRFKEMLKMLKKITSFLQTNLFKKGNL